MKILVVDDSKEINKNLSEYLNMEGFETVSAFDGEEAIELFKEELFDLILLDVMMPKKDGFEVCREIRKTSMVPVIMVTARGEDFERIMGLEIGADDYIVKPFSSEEVVARIKALFRRITLQNDSINRFTYDNLVIDMDKYIVQINSEHLSLTKKEIELLWTLATNAGKVFTRDNLLDSIWGYDYYGDSRTVDTHIKRLRAKINRYTHPKWNITTMRGVGYKFEVIE
ncbi:response regulator transcription factor [Anaerosphaera multitolerans]|uniref:DNA-binding response regulator n=1 Tax=Anaerosphaera multitolerans TaxID=2487351 RepID=A0A437S823_9FIRM|nr:response regulator transcription factor [Anaerosphaera multitolerans]RVU54987.1 DNA-binding response regulator [Anaerosphaera multitolerans]